MQDVIYTHVIFNVWFARGQQEDSGGLVMPVLASEVEGRKPPVVSELNIGLRLHQVFCRLTEPPPGGAVQGGIPMLKSKVDIERDSTKAKQRFPYLRKFFVMI